MGLSKFLSKKEQQAIVQSIKTAESCTSGEIRVHVEPKCPTDNALDRAVDVFKEIGMYKTQERNGVLIYIAYESRVFAIIGDTGINDRVPSNFWEDEKNTLVSYLKKGKPSEGLCEIILQIGEKLKDFFPHKDDDINEQSDEISYSE